MSHKWCGHCQENFPEDHYDEHQHHKVGYEWGPTGANRAEIRDLRAALDRIANHSLDEQCDGDCALGLVAVARAALKAVDAR